MIATFESVGGGNEMRVEEKQCKRDEDEREDTIASRAHECVCVCVCVCACVHACVVEGRKEGRKELWPYGSFCALNCRELKQIENGV
jgi:hypothetical protein